MLLLRYDVIDLRMKSPSKYLHILFYLHVKYKFMEHNTLEIWTLCNLSNFECYRNRMNPRQRMCIIKFADQCSLSHVSLTCPSLPSAHHEHFSESWRDRYQTLRPLHPITSEHATRWSSNAIFFYRLFISKYIYVWTQYRVNQLLFISVWSY